MWLEKDFLAYIRCWEETTPDKASFLTGETYEALRVTTMSTVLCIRHLLDVEFKDVLAFRYLSDYVESLFSAVTVKRVQRPN